MHRFHRLTVALSRTDADAALLRYAAAVAKLGTATEVRFVHVLPTDAEDGDAARRALAADAAAHFAGVPAGVARSFDVLRGPLLDQLLEHSAATQADLLFLAYPCDPGRRGLARRLAMKAPCSLWIVPEGAPATLKRILVPVDFSAPAADALRVGASLAKLSGGECLGLHVYFNEAVRTFDEYEEVLRGQEREAFAKFVASLDLDGVPVAPVIEEGANPAHVINRVAAARGCDLVVMATRGRSRSAAILLGSVAEEAITDTAVPLLVVKHYGAQIGFLRALWDRTVHQPNKTRF